MSATKPTIKIAVADWWDRSVQKEFMHENPILRLLAPFYNFVYDAKPDFLLYSVFGSEHLKYQHPCIKIFYTGENVRTDWNLCDYGIDFDFLEFGERHLYLPLFVLPEFEADLQGALIKHQCDRDILEQKKKFCAFMVTNGDGNPIRGEFFDRLSRYKKVDSGGRWRNNIGGAIGDRFADFPTSKYHWLKDYKFNICFENSSYPGYVTEKIIQAFRAKCVPIYWGDSRLCDESLSSFRPIFNPKAFVNIHSFKNLDEAIEYIAWLDNDDKAFLQMLQEPMFLDSEINKKWLGEDGGGGIIFIVLNSMSFSALFLKLKSTILTLTLNIYKAYTNKHVITKVCVLNVKDLKPLSTPRFIHLLKSFFQKRKDNYETTRCA